MADEAVEMEEKLTLRERHLLLWVFKQKRLSAEGGSKYAAFDESALKSLFAPIFFGTYKCLANLKVHSGGVESLVFYENKVFSASQDHTVRVMEADSYKPLATLGGHGGPVFCLKLYRNKLFSGSTGPGSNSEGSSSSIHVWNADSLERIGTLEGAAISWMINFALYESKDGRTNTLFASNGKNVGAWNADTHEHLATMTGHGEQVLTITLKGNRLYSGSIDSTVRVWDADTHQLKAILRGGHRGWVNCSTCCGDKVYSGSIDGSIAVWTDDDKLEARLKGHEGWVNFLLACTKTNKLFSGGEDGTIHVWGIATNELITVLKDPGHSDHIWVLALYGNKLFSGSADSSIRVWNSETHEPVTILGGHPSTVRYLNIDHAAGQLMTCSEEGTMRIWTIKEDDSNALKRLVVKV